MNGIDCVIACNFIFYLKVVISKEGEFDFASFNNDYDCLFLWFPFWCFDC